MEVYLTIILITLISYFEVDIVRLISTPSTQRSSTTMSRSLIGGAQPRLAGGPLSPAPHIKEVGAEARTIRFDR
jgi:hypothetical protein